MSGTRVLLNEGTIAYKKNHCKGFLPVPDLSHHVGPHENDQGFVPQFIMKKEEEDEEGEDEEEEEEEEREEEEEEGRRQEGKREGRNSKNRTEAQ